MGGSKTRVKAEQHVQARAGRIGNPWEGEGDAERGVGHLGGQVCPDSSGSQWPLATTLPVSSLAPCWLTAPEEAGSSCFLLVHHCTSHGSHTSATAAAHRHHSGTVAPHAGLCHLWRQCGPMGPWGENEKWHIFMFYCLHHRFVSPPLFVTAGRVRSLRTVRDLSDPQSHAPFTV